MDTGDGPGATGRPTAGARGSRQRALERIAQPLTQDIGHGPQRLRLADRINAIASPCKPRQTPPHRPDPVRGRRPLRPPPAYDDSDPIIIALGRLPEVGLRYKVGQADVYTLTVAHDHTFFVGATRVLVHNASGCYGMASQIDDLSGKPRPEVDALLQARGATKKATAGGYTHYRFPDRSEIVIRPDGRVVRTPAPVYGPTGARTNRGARLDQYGRLTTSHDTGEKLSD